MGFHSIRKILSLAVFLFVPAAWADGFLYPIQVGGKTGFINSSGKTVVEPKYDHVAYSQFSQGHFIYPSGNAVVKVGKAYGVLNSRGVEVLPVRPENGTLLPLRWDLPRPDPLIKYSEKGFEGLMDPSGGKISPAIYQSLRICEEDFSGKTILIGTYKSKAQLVGLDGKTLPDMAFDYVGCGLGSGKLMNAIKDRKWGFVDEKLVWNPVLDIASQDLEDAKEWQVQKNSKGEVVVIASRNKRWGVMDLQGREVVPFQYDEIFGAGKSLLVARRSDQRKIINHRGKVLAVSPRKIGYIDDPLFFVDDNGRLGFVDGETDTVINGRFDLASDGSYFAWWIKKDKDQFFAVVSDGDRQAIIDRQGRYVAPPDFSKISWWSDEALEEHHLIEAWKGDSCGYINLKGEIKIPFRFRDCEEFYGDVAVACDPNGNSNNCGLINLQGQWVHSNRFAFAEMVIETSFGKQALFLTEIEDPVCKDMLFAYSNRQGEFVYKSQCENPVVEEPDQPLPPEFLPIPVGEYATTLLADIENRNSNITLGRSKLFESGLWYQNGKGVYEFEVNPNEPVCWVLPGLSGGNSMVSWPAQQKAIVAYSAPVSDGYQIHFSWTGSTNLSVQCQSLDGAVSIAQMLRALFQQEEISKTEFWRKLWK